MFLCGLYTRVSTIKQVNVQEGSLKTQESRLRDYVKYRASMDEAEKWEVVKVYEDGGKSGKNADRPALREMMADIVSGRVNMVICTKIDRISRSVVDFSNLWKMFERYNVQFVSLAENFDSSSAIGRAMLKLTLVFAELERETISERTRGKALWRAEQGLWNGNVVLGYDIDLDKKGHLVVNEEEAQVVRKVFDAYLDTKSILETAKWLNSRGFTSKAYVSRGGIKKDGQKFLGSTIYKIITNPVYVGKIRFKGEDYRGRHSGIISQELWDAVQKSLERPLKERVKRARHRQKPFLLAGLLRCGYCGSYMTPFHAVGRKKKRYFYYQCTTRIHNGRGDEKEGCCKMMHVPADEIDELVIGQLKRISLDSRFIADIVMKANEKSGEGAEKLEKEKQNLISRKSAIEKKKANLVGFVESGVFGEMDESGKAEYLERIREVKADLVEIESAISRLEFQIADEESRIYNARIIQEGLLRFTELFDRAKDEEKKELLSLIINKIIFTPEKLNLFVYECPEIKEIEMSQDGEETEKTLSGGNCKMKPQLKEKGSKKDKTLPHKGGELMPLNKEGHHSLGSPDKVVCRKKHYYRGQTIPGLWHTRMK
jgi:site-specific DNA recombinase